MNFPWKCKGDRTASGLWKEPVKLLCDFLLSLSLSLLLEVVDFLEADEEAETLMEEEEAPMEDEEILEAQINGVASVRRTLMKRKIVGTKESHNVIIAKGLDICRKIVCCKISSM